MSQFPICVSIIGFKQMNVADELLRVSLSD